MSEASRLNAAFAVIFGGPCACPERHAASGACHQKAETATDAGGMCVPCAQAYWGNDWLGDQPLLAASEPVNRPWR